MKLNKILIPCFLAALSALICIFVLSTKAQAEVHGNEGDYTYRIRDGLAYIQGYKGEGGDVTIPDTFENFPVGEIQSKAFSGCSLTSITIPDTVIYVSPDAFNNCSNLNFNIYDNAKYLGSTKNPYLVLYKATSTDITNCTIHKDTRIIVESAFENCDQLSTIVIPDKVRSIEDFAFSGCSKLNSIDIGSQVTIIGEGAFQGCESLTDIVIPNNVITLGSGVFSGCSGLTSMSIPFVGNSGDASYSYSYPFGYLFGSTSYEGSTETKQIYRYVDYKQSTAICYIPSRLQTVTITGGSIPYGAFSNCTNLTNIIISSNIINIDPLAFYGCDNLTFNTYDNAKYLGTSENPYLFLYKAVSTDISSCTIHQDTKIIGGNAFSNCYHLKNIAFPGNVTTIGHFAFYRCDALTSVTIPNTVTRIDAAFYECEGLTCVTISDAVTFLDEDAFRGCPVEELIVAEGSKTVSQKIVACIPNIKKVTIPNNVTIIGERAFQGCNNLTSITIPNCVTTVGDYAFQNCVNLTSITIPNSVTTIGYSAFSGCKGLTSIEIPGSVTSIGSYAFSSCENLASVTIGNGVTTIPSYAFIGCTGLTSITIPNSVTTISDGVFYECSGLVSITLPNNVATISDDIWRGVFEGCSNLTFNVYDNAKYLGSSSNPYLYLFEAVSKDISSCTIHEEARFIAHNAFQDCVTLTSITIPDSVTSVGERAFYMCSSLTNISIPNSVANFSNHLQGIFTGCSNLTFNVYDNAKYLGNSSNPYLYLFEAVSKDISSCTIHEEARFIAHNAFQDCVNLTSITIPNSVTTIGDYAFQNCVNLTSITIPNSVTTIGYSAFSGCKGLTSIEIPGSVTSIGGGALKGCSGLTDITIPFVGAGPASTIGEGFYTTFAYLFDATVHSNDLVPSGNHIPNTLKSVTVTGGDLMRAAFIHCSGLTSITLPNSVTTIPDQAFSGCSGLTSITIPDSVTHIGNNAFRSCKNLASITMGNGVRTIDRLAFTWCESLTSITFSNSLAYIGEYAFQWCTGLTSIEIPNSVTTIDEFAFYGCIKLNSITIGSGVSRIGADAFRRCTTLNTVTLSNSINKIEASAFMHCVSLADVVFNGSQQQKSAIEIAGGSTFLLNAKWTYHNGSLLDGEFSTTLIVGVGVLAVLVCSIPVSILVKRKASKKKSYK